MGILFPYGNTAGAMLYGRAKEEFGDAIKGADGFTGLQNDISRALRKMDGKKLLEERLRSVATIEHINATNLDGYVSAKLGLFAAFLTALQISPLRNLEAETTQCVSFGIVCSCFFTLIVLAHRKHKVTAILEYQKFRLMCIEAVLKEKKIRFL